MVDREQSASLVAGSAIAGSPSDANSDLCKETATGRALISTMPASDFDRRLAFAVMIMSVAVFVAAVPFVRVPLAKLPSFIPTYEAALAINDLITAVLLFGQLSRLRWLSLMVLACGYLFSSFSIVVHLLTFPEAFSPTGLLGAGDQTTAWLYVFWHAGFPISVLGYALLRNAGPAVDSIGENIRAVTACAIILVVAAIVALTLLSTWGMQLLPILIENGDFSRLISTGTSPAILVLCSLALLALWRQRQRTVLDVWLMVVMCVWLFDVTLSAVISSARYDLGWYVGRIYGLCAASFVFVVLLLEMNELHAKLAQAQDQLSDHARDLEGIVRERIDDLRRSNESLKLEVADRENAEQELRRTRAFLDVVIESVPAMLLVKDAKDGRCVLLNRTGEELLGCDRRDVIGQIADDIMPIVEENLVRQPSKSASEQGYQIYEHTLVTRSRGERLVRTRKVPMRDENGEEKYKLRFTDDITEQRRTEEQLRHSQKMEALGQLTGGLAHDFNNLLAVVIGNLDLLRQTSAIGEADDELVKEALEAAVSGGELTSRLLAFARRQPLKLERIDVNVLIEGVSKLLSRTLRGNIKVKLAPDPAIPAIVADRVQLETALTNLANNARDAMPEGGALTISTRNGVLDENYAAQHTEVQPGKYVTIEVTDSGHGMTPEVMKRIFEPFYTTKGLGKGTGLGLSMVFGFMKQCGGHVNVYSEVGRGSTFRLYLPPAEATPLVDAGEVGLLPPRQSKAETILVVEDNAKVCKLVVKQLTAFGYEVVAVDNADAALSVLESRGDVAVLFSDVVLSDGMDGFALAREVTKRYPDIKILMTSGFPGTSLQGLDELGARLLSKPYRESDLASALSSLLGNFDRPLTEDHAA
jgi:PAS domain S-box-containing protein